MGSKKKIQTVCLDCGNKYKTFDKSVMGVWYDSCDICKKQNTPCAAAWHDFGIREDIEVKYIKIT